MRSVIFAAIAASMSFPVQAAPLCCDFHYAPPEWQAAICLPDDPCKTLVDKSGELLYHFGRGGREFATRVAVEVADGVVWKRQDLLSPRVPVMRTTYEAAGLQIVEEAFAVSSSLGKSENAVRTT